MVNPKHAKHAQDVLEVMRKIQAETKDKAQKKVVATRTRMLEVLLARNQRRARWRAALGACRKAFFVGLGVAFGALHYMSSFVRTRDETVKRSK